MLDKTLQNEPDQSAIDTVNLSRIRAAQEQHASETGSLRSTFAKAELQGLHLGAAKRALKVIKSDKVDEMIDEITKTLEYLRLMGRKVSAPQLDMFIQSPPSAPEDEKAENQGRVAGMMGHQEGHNPFDPASAKGRAWITGFRDGEAQRKLVMSMPEPAASDADDGDDEDE